MILTHDVYYALCTYKFQFVVLQLNIFLCVVLVVCKDLQLAVFRAFLEAIVPEISLEADVASQVMITFLRQLYMHYHKYWISSKLPRCQKLRSLHVHGGEEGVLDDVSH